MSKSTPDHESFEKQVYAIYKSLGYTVELDVLVSGQQVDVLASKNIAGLGVKKIVIECKHTKNRSIANQGVYDFIAYITTLKSQGEDFEGILVTNATFTRQARQAASKSPHIHLKTIDELEKSVFDPTDALLQLIHAYEAEQIFENYISISGKIDSQLTGRVPIQDVTEHLFRKMSEDNASCTVFGDFGSGKTTLLKRLQYKFAKSYIEGRLKKFPLLIELKEVNRYGQDILTAAIEKNTSIKVTHDKAKWLVEREIFFLLLDGFDEISSAATEKERTKQLDGIGHFALSNCPTILTCRPTYFLTRQEFLGHSTRYSFDKYSLANRNRALRENAKFLAKHTGSENSIPQNTLFDLTVDIEPLSESSIDAYLKAHRSEFKSKIGATVPAVARFIASVYDLQDLITRPLLLDMIVETLLSGKINIRKSSKSYGPSKLYSLYTGVSLERDFAKGSGSQFLTSDLRELFCRRLAVFFSKNGVLSLSNEDLFNFLQEVSAAGLFPPEKSRDLEKLLTDVRVCTFLRISDDDGIRFSHKSFAEFFTALEFVEAMRNEEPGDELDFQFNLETIGFLSSFLIEDNEYQSLAFSKIRDRSLSKNERRNLLAAVCGAPEVFPSLRIGSEVISDIKAPNAVYNSYIFEGTRFNRVDVGTTIFKKAKFGKFGIHDCRFNDVNFESCSGEVKLSECQLSDWTIQDSELEIVLEKNALGRLQIADCKRILISGPLNSSELSIVRSRVSISTTNEARGVPPITNAVFEESRIASTNSPAEPTFDLFNCEKIYFRSCEILGMLIKQDCLKNSIGGNESSEANPFTDSLGIIFVASGIWNTNLASIVARNPNLVVIPVSLSDLLHYSRYTVLSGFREEVRTKLNSLRNSEKSGDTLKKACGIVSALTETRS